MKNLKSEPTKIAKSQLYDFTLYLILSVLVITRNLLFLLFLPFCFFLCTKSFPIKPIKIYLFIYLCIFLCIIHIRLSVCFSPVSSLPPLSFPFFLYHQLMLFFLIPLSFFFLSFFLPDFSSFIFTCSFTCVSFLSVFLYPLHFIIYRYSSFFLYFAFLSYLPSSYLPLLLSLLLLYLSVWRLIVLKSC